MPENLGKYRLFISHSSKDKELAKAIKLALAKADAKVWVDHESIEIGDSIPSEIEEGLNWSNTLLLIWSKHCINSKWIEKEWHSAFHLEKKIVCIKIDDTDLPALLASNLYLEINDEKDIPKLIGVLKSGNIPEPIKKKKKKRVLLLIIALVLLSIILIVYNIYESLTGKDIPNAVTVMVKGKIGLDNLKSPERGRIELVYDENTASVFEYINTEGKATFNHIPKQYFEEGNKVKFKFSDPEGGEPFTAISPDSLYQLTGGDIITIPIKLKGVDKIYGRVVDSKEYPIENAEVSIWDIKTLTKSDGLFELNIPLEKQKKFQTVKVNKDGYHPSTYNNIPPQTEEGMTIVLDKK